MPGIMAWPAVVKSGPNTESWHTVISSDFLPTMLEVLGVSRPASQQAWAMDGVSQLSFLKGEPVAPRCIGHLFADGACSLRSFVHGCTRKPERLAVLQGTTKATAVGSGRSSTAPALARPPTAPPARCSVRPPRPSLRRRSRAR